MASQARNAVRWLALLAWQLAPHRLLRYAIIAGLIALITALGQAVAEYPRAPPGEIGLQLALIAKSTLTSLQPLRDSAAGAGFGGFVRLLSTLALLCLLAAAAASLVLQPLLLALARRLRVPRLFDLGSAGETAMSTMLVAQGPAVLGHAVAASESAALQRDPERPGHLVISYHANRGLPVGQAKTLFLLGTDTENLRRLEALATSPAPGLRALFVRIEDRWLRRDLQDAFVADLHGRGIELRAASSAEIAFARHFRQQPIGRLSLYDGEGRPRPMQIIIVGTGAAVVDAIVVAARNLASIRTEVDSIILVGDDAAAVCERMHEECPALAATLPLEALVYPAIDALSAPLLIAQIEKRGWAPAALLIACGDSVTDDKWARALTRLSARLPHPGCPIRSVSALLGGTSGLAAGSHAETLEDVLLGEKMGRYVHEYYLGRYGWNNRGDGSWATLDFDFRDDSIAQAEHFWTKASDACLLAARLSTGLTSAPDLAAPLLEALAEAEHRRWMLARMTQGWSLADHKDQIRRLHPCMKPWAELPEAVRDQDRSAVAAMPEILALAGWGLCHPGSLDPSSDKPAPVGMLTARAQVSTAKRDLREGQPSYWGIVEASSDAAFAAAKQHWSRWLRLVAEASS